VRKGRLTEEEFDREFPPEEGGQKNGKHEPGTPPAHTAAPGESHPPHSPAEWSSFLAYARDRVEKAVAHYGPAVDGQKGSQRTFHVAAMLANDLDLPDPDAWSIFQDYNARHCLPPWPLDGSGGLRRKLDEGREKGRAERGHLARRYWQRNPPGAKTAVPVTPDGRSFLWSSELRRLPPHDKWLWHGILSRGGVTLLSALWKAGKTTLLARLLQAFGAGGSVCGLEVKPARVMFVTEEDENTWAERRDELGLGDWVGWRCRPFRGRPSPAQWLDFIATLSRDFRKHGFDVLVIDTLAKLWPVKDENDASPVDEALMPLWDVGERASVLLSHHLRKGDGAEATGSRGSGALTAFVETIIELRRLTQDKRDSRRVLSGYGRFRETPAELTIDLTPDGYVAVGDPHEVRRSDATELLLDALPTTEPGLTADQIAEAAEMAKKTVLPLLAALESSGRVTRSGEGRRGDPKLYRRAPDSGVSISPPRVEMETPDEGDVSDRLATLLDGGGQWSVADLCQESGAGQVAVLRGLAHLVASGRARRLDYDEPSWVAERTIEGDGQ
jgi:hypothetical protein